MNYMMRSARESLRGHACRKNSLECMKRLMDGGDTSLADRLKSAKAQVDAVEYAMSSLSEENRDVLREFYVAHDGESIDRLCRKYCCSVSTVYRMCRDALRTFTMTLYGRAE
ncbi:MAG: hypothetical protein MJ096_01535 [Clostridia bacterium]|nr:hypothetical protein [Clostridia bacterium]